MAVSISGSSLKTSLWLPLRPHHHPSSTEQDNSQQCWAAHSPLAPQGQGQEDRGHGEGFLSHGPSSTSGAEDDAQEKTAQAGKGNPRLVPPWVKEVDGT